MVIQGIIRPPPEIRAVADRTALYVAKNGRAFEKKILASEKGRTPKFAFLQDTSPFHAYYENRVQFYESGGDDKKEAPAKSDANNQSDKENAASDEKGEPSKKQTKEPKAQKVASVVDPVAKALLTQRTKIAQFRKEAAKISKDTDDTVVLQQEGETKVAVTIPPPPPLQFINVVAPASLTLAQIETIQLVAQFTALDGRGGSFLPQLSMREWNNPEFGFCQTRHPHFAYFSALVDGYRRVLDLWTQPPSAESRDNIKELANQPKKCLELAAYRAEYERDQELQASHLEEGGQLGDQVDWHNFVVVETIDFPPDEVVEISMLPPPPSQLPQTKTLSLPASSQKDTMDESEEEDDQDGEQIRVVPSYQPKVVATHQNNKLETVIDPITGKRVAVQDMPEHMRIQLLDPKWAEERKKFQEKQKDSNLVSSDMVASNLQRLAQSRSGNRSDGAGSTTASGRVAESSNSNLVNSGTQQRAGTVGPSLPGLADSRKRPGLSLPPPSHSVPDAKRARSDLSLPPPPAPMASQAPPPPPPTTIVQAPPPPPPSTRPEEAFAAAATGMASSTTTTASSRLLSEAEFAASLDKPAVTLQVRVPNDPSQMAWNFYGQIVSISVDVMSTVKTLKEELARTHLNSIPANKIQLRHVATGTFLSNPKTLASLNVGPTATLELATRTRGGRKG